RQQCQHQAAEHDQPSVSWVRWRLRVELLGDQIEYGIGRPAVHHLLLGSSSGVLLVHRIFGPCACSIGREVCGGCSRAEGDQGEEGEGGDHSAADQSYPWFEQLPAVGLGLSRSRWVLLR